MIDSILYKRIKNALPFFLTAILFMSMLGGIPESAAEDGVSNDYGTIKSIPSTKYEGFHDFLKSAETYYDFIGTVDDIQKKGIVVNDSYMKFAPNANISGARQGARIGIRLNPAGEVSLCEPVGKSTGKQ
jgi:hypothetical protein